MNVLLVAYALIAQLFPGVVIGGIFWQRATKQGVVVGLLVGWAVSATLMLTGHDPVAGLNAGFVGLLCNSVAFAATSLMTRPSGTSQPISTTLRDIAAETARRGAPRTEGDVGSGPRARVST